MATQNETKLKILVRNLEPGTIVLAHWLEELGISRSLLNHYLHSGWLEAVGRGAYKRPNDNVKWIGGIYSLQNQAKLNIHIGATSALSILGLSHYFRLGKETVYLFSPYRVKLPKWFDDYDWGTLVNHQQTSFIPEIVGLVKQDVKNISVKISSPERAIMECLYLSPKKLDLIECYHLMEGLVNLKPKLVQELLDTCNSVRVKRLFLYLAEKVNHQWLNFLDNSNIDLGNGNRRISENGVYISKYQITIPRELAAL
ncbi:MAG TPA: type IV toxin-antitoxin system AbiEi family antitoxin [Bacteroidales bacterium]|nr:type IV toxin-antitoxin system AbiEi family antitoxin [Bacteroidales bacterium]